MESDELVVFLRRLAHSLAADLARRSPPVRLTVGRLRNHEQWLQVRINGEKLGLVVLPVTRDSFSIDPRGASERWSEPQKQIWRKQINAFLKREHVQPGLARK